MFTVKNNWVCSAESCNMHAQVNNNATVMISTLIDDGVHERIILPEFPYLTDENGGIYAAGYLGPIICATVIFLPLIFCTCGNLLSDIYFEVDNDDAVMESIMGDDKIAVTILLFFSTD